FSIEGAAHLTFGGTNAPDIFNVTTSGDYLAAKNHYGVGTFHIDNDQILSPAIAPGTPSPFDDPVYTVTRTFGTNGKTQTIPFSVHDADSSSIGLDGAGASDTYTTNLGLGGFLDVDVSDSDTTTQNNLTVNFRDRGLIGTSAVLTNNSLHLDYYTELVLNML